MRKTLAVCMLFLFVPVFTLLAQGKGVEDFEALAEEAYIFGYPLVMMDVSVGTMAPRPTDLNKFEHIRAFPDHTFTDVASPNADTLYSSAWLDLSGGPITLSVPEMDYPKRYYLMQCLDAWTNVFASIGTRTNGNRKGSYMIVGPSWKGPLPQDIGLFKSPTDRVWILGRTQTNTSADYTAVNAIQDKYDLQPLEKDDKKLSGRETNGAKSPVEVMDGMEASEFFNRLNMLMSGNPPALADAPLIARVAKIGVVPGKPFDITRFAASDAKSIRDGFDSGRKKVIEDSMAKETGVKIGDWSVMSKDIGRFSTDYMFRAIIARVAIGANMPEDAIYPTARTLLAGEPLDGSRKYTVTFSEVPPVKAFWSLTMYDGNQRFIENPINRYAIGDRSEGIGSHDYGRYGPLVIYVQHLSPGGDKELYWLPAPEGNFNLIMRFYWPEDPLTIYNGGWPMPELRVTED